MFFHVLQKFAFNIAFFVLPTKAIEDRIRETWRVVALAGISMEARVAIVAITNLMQGYHTNAYTPNHGQFPQSVEKV